MLLSSALCLLVENGPYSTVDGRCLIAVTNMLRALVLGGVHGVMHQRVCVEYRQTWSEFSEL